jgi:formylmethanofuran dehydrogenase subunit E
MTNETQTAKAPQVKCDWCGQLTGQEDVIYIEEVDAYLCPECYWQYTAENTERTDLT